MNHWQEFKTVHLYQLTNESQELIEAQKSDIPKSFLQLSGPYVVREEFKQKAKNFNTEFMLLTIEEKKNLKQDLLNVFSAPKTTSKNS